MFTEEELSRIKEYLKPSKKIVIITHHNPDGDAIGSSLGLAHALVAAGLSPEVIVPNDFPKFLKWMPNAKKITIAEYKRRKASELIKEADVIFCLDFNTMARIGILGDWAERSRAIKVLIDHHQMPDAFDFVYSDTTIPATAQLIFNFLQAAGYRQFIGTDAAQCLYTGIMTDTGGFRFRSTSAETHRTVADLIDLGADPAFISSSILDTNTVGRLKLLSIVLGRLQVVCDGRVAILSLTRDELKEYGFQKGDTEGFVNYGLSIMGARVAAFFMEDLYEDFIKISFRSKGDTDVNQFARKYFNGGGHINAAGGKYYKGLSETVEDFIHYAEQEGL
ncbi:MAG: bifunctional oligoribonuclease/PAP phosphatase NrnA [Chryseobacterium sp.]|nr:MAG: bifunctional oligoribonuclease/PAP phosphatase NrnA [Chryseobacterium sp.]